MISLNITGKLNLPSAFLDSSLNIKTDEERLYRVFQKELYNWTCSKSSSFHS
jgi:predicted component of type VI protein secretion system